MSFKPEGHEKYTVGPYMKFNTGPTTVGKQKSYKIRILSESITGYEYWIDASGNIVPRNERAGEGGSPVRLRADAEFTREQISAMKMFAAMVVYNYEFEKVQILEVKQSKILNGLNALLDSSSWGDVQDYDINIVKSKTGPEDMNVEYSVMPEPKEELSKEVLEAYDATSINLEALFDGEDPFATNEDVDPSEVKV